MPTSRLGSPYARRRWSREDAREVLAALDRSGQPVRVFAEEHGLDPQRLYQWRRRLGEAEPTPFQEIIVRPLAPRDAPFEVIFASGDIVRVPSSFDAAALASLLEVLARARAC